MNWNQIFNPNDFIQKMIELDEIESHEIENNDPYHYIVGGLCHNSCAWMFDKVKNNLKICKNLYFVTGSYSMEGIFKGLNHDHSWIEYREEGKETIVIDLTIAQFGKIKDQLYIGKKPIEFNEWEAISFQNQEEVKKLINRL